MLGGTLDGAATELIATPRRFETATTGSEYPFLLSCVRSALEFRAAKEPLHIPEHGISWQRFLGLAARHQVLPLARLALLRSEGGIPDSVRMWLDERCKTLAALNLSLAAELVDLLALCQTQDIKAVPFKGPALAAAFYGSISRRQISDLDIFVGEGQFAAAAEVMRRRGYEPEDRVAGVSWQSLRLKYKDILFTHPESGIHVDLHWSIAEPGFDKRLSSMPIPGGTFGVSLLGQEIAMQAPEDLLLLLCVHGLRHRWETLKWICDLACLLRARPEFNWQAALKSARAVSRERTLLLGVGLVRELTEVPLPAEIAELIANDAALPTLCRQIYHGHDSECKVAAPLSAGAVLGGAAFDAMRLRTRERGADRLGLFLKLIAERLRPGAEDRQWISIPKFAAVLYWVVRPIRILRFYGPACSLRLLRELICALCKPAARQECVRLTVS